MTLRSIGMIPMSIVKPRKKMLYVIKHALMVIKIAHVALVADGVPAVLAVAIWVALDVNFY
jgi:hypothetical protein